MFPVQFVFKSVCSQGIQGWGSHVIITNNSLDLTVQGPPQPWPLEVRSGGQDCRPVQSCSLEENVTADGSCWKAAYWYAFLLPPAKEIVEK